MPATYFCFVNEILVGITDHLLSKKGAKLVYRLCNYVFYSLFRLIDISVDISAKDMKDRIEEVTTKIGKVSVYRFGTCSGYEWEIFFETVGGHVKTLQVISSSVTGNLPSVTVVTIQDGGILYGPLTGEFLRLPKSSPQVSLRHSCLIFSYKNLFRFAEIHIPFCWIVQKLLFLYIFYLFLYVQIFIKHKKLSKYSF